MDKKAYQCDNPGCECRDVSIRHCPGCGELYFFRQDDPDAVCAMCEILAGEGRRLDVEDLETLLKEAAEEEDNENQG